MSDVANAMSAALMSPMYMYECNVRRGWVGENFLNVSVMLAHVDATGAI